MVRLAILQIWLSALFIITVIAQTEVKVRINPNTPLVKPDDRDYPHWTVTGGTSSSYTQNGVTFQLSTSGTDLRGSRFKVMVSTMQPLLGERVLGEGISTDSTTGNALTLKLTGLTTGTRTLLTYHNAWDNLSKTANIKVTVNGNTVISSLAQTIRRDSFWDAATSYLSFSVTGPSQAVIIVYQAIATSGVTDLRTFINGFEIDTQNIKNQISFPIPARNDEHYEGGASSTLLKWAPPKSGAAASFDVYIGTSRTSLSRVSNAQTGTSYTASGKAMILHSYQDISISAA